MPILFVTPGAVRFLPHPLPRPRRVNVTDGLTYVALLPAGVRVISRYRTIVRKLRQCYHIGFLRIHMRQLRRRHSKMIGRQLSGIACRVVAR